MSEKGIDLTFDFETFNQLDNLWMFHYLNSNDEWPNFDNDFLLIVKTDEEDGVRRTKRHRTHPREYWHDSIEHSKSLLPIETRLECDTIGNSKWRAKHNEWDQGLSAFFCHLDFLFLIVQQLSSCPLLLFCNCATVHLAPFKLSEIF